MPRTQIHRFPPGTTVNVGFPDDIKTELQKVKDETSARIAEAEDALEGHINDRLGATRSDLIGDFRTELSLLRLRPTIEEVVAAQLDPIEGRFDILDQHFRDVEATLEEIQEVVGEPSESEESSESSEESSEELSESSESSAESSEELSESSESSAESSESSEESSEELLLVSAPRLSRRRVSKKVSRAPRSPRAPSGKRK